MSDYISRELASKRLTSYAKGIDETDTFGAMLRAIISDIPAADVREVKLGKWVYEHDYYGSRYRCSSCGYTIHPVDESGARYCPNCWADMRAKEGET